MTRYQARIFELAGLAEFPHDLIGLLRSKTLTVRIIVFHVRVLPHHFGMFEILLRGPEDEFVVELAVVAQDELDLFVLLDVDPVRKNSILPSASIIVT